MSNPFYNKGTREIEESVHSELQKEREETEKAFNETQKYTDSIAEGGHWKQSVAVVTQSEIADFTSPPSSIDGVTLEEEDRVLVKDQTTASENGIYILNSNGEFERASDFDVDDDVDGAIAYVKNGNSDAEHRYSVIGQDTSNDNEVIVGTDDIVFTKISGTGQITAGAGMTKDSPTNTININATDDSVNVNADDINVNVDEGTVTKTLNGISIPDNAITTTKIDAGAVTSNEIDASVPGTGLTGGEGSPLSIPSGGVTETQIASSVSGKGLTGGAGNALQVEERFCFESGMKDITAPTTDQEENRLVLQTGEQLIVDRIEFRQQGGGSSTDASVEVFDNSAGALLAEVNLGNTSLNPGSTNAGNTITVLVNNETGATITATIRVIGRIVS